MLSQEEFERWCNRLNLPDATRTVIQQVRSSEPSRRVGSGRGNVAGIYPSLKMGVTIQFEAHRTELARIYEFERDPDVLEYYDQPPPIELTYLSKSGRTLRHLYTPDFFIIRKNFAGWEECKPENDLTKLSERNSNRYQKGEDGIWRCPPGEAYAERFGLQFWVWSSASISWIFQQNFIWLADYFNLECHAVQKDAVQEILSLIQAKIGITLAELLQSVEIATVDDIYTLIATEKIYVNLNAASFSESHLVRVFLNEEVATALERTIQADSLSVRSLAEIT